MVVANTRSFREAVLSLAPRDCLAMLWLLREAIDGVSLCSCVGTLLELGVTLRFAWAEMDERVMFKFCAGFLGLFPIVNFGGLVGRVASLSSTLSKVTTPFF